MARRALTWWGIGFLVALLLSAGMASVPTGDDPVRVVRSFYVDHAGVVIVAQLIGLVAAAAFLMFSRQLASTAPDADRPGLWWTGAAVAAAAFLTALPPLWLSFIASGASAPTLHGLARASDATDVLLFTTIAAFAAMVARASSSWLRPVAALVGLISLARAVLLATGQSALEAVAPVAFLALVALVILAVRTHAFAGAATEA
jgi:hypothetical protein